MKSKRDNNCKYSDRVVVKMVIDAIEGKNGIWCEGCCTSNYEEIQINYTLKQKNVELLL